LESSSLISSLSRASFCFVQTKPSTLFPSSQCPFVRPNFKELLQALDFAIEHDYPARGEYTGAL
jgi:hypothetical protein